MSQAFSWRHVHSVMLHFQIHPLPLWASRCDFLRGGSFQQSLICASSHLFQLYLTGSAWLRMRLAGAETVLCEQWQAAIRGGHCCACRTWQQFMIYKPISARNGNPGIAPVPSTFRKWIAKFSSRTQFCCSRCRNSPGAHFKGNHSKGSRLLRITSTLNRLPRQDERVRMKHMCCAA